MNWAGVLGTETVADSFSSKSFGNNDGTQSWSTQWSEVDVGASEANGGHIKVNSGQLRIETQVFGASVSRGVDLSAASSATLSFDFTNDLDRGGSVEIRISTDGGTSYQTLSGGTFWSTDHAGSGRVSFDISSYASANTKIQFAVTGSSGGDRLFVDNIQVNYVTGMVDPGPTALTLTGNTVVENATSGTAVGTVSGTDPYAGDTKTYSLTDTAGGRFAIDASTGQLTVADGSLLNYETQADHSITVTVTDSEGQSIDRTFIVHLTNVDEAPRDITLTGDTVAENAATGTVVGTAVGIDPDTGDTKTYSLTDTAGGRCAINETTGEITVADGSLLNYETQASHSVTIQVTDAGGLTMDKTFTINLTNVAEAPTALTLTGHMVVEHATTGTVVGTVSGTDPDASDTKTYSLTDTAGGRFAINSSTGVITVADGSLLNYEAAASHTITVRVTDTGGQGYDETVTINLTNVNQGLSDEVARDNPDGGLIGSLFGNSQRSPSSTEKSIDLLGEPGMGDVVSLSTLPNDSHHTIEWSAEAVSIVEPGPLGRNSAQYVQAEVATHGKGESQTSPTAGGKGMAESLDSEQSLSDPGRAAGPWTWSQTDEVEAGQDGSALGLSMAVGLAGMVWQGNKGSKEKMTTMKSQLQTLHQQSLPDGTSQQPNEEDDKASSNESQ